MQILSEKVDIFIQIRLFGTLQIEKEYASYFFLPNHKADIPKQSLLLNNFVKLAKLGPNCMFRIASASLFLQEKLKPKMSAHYSSPRRR